MEMILVLVGVLVIVWLITRLTTKFLKKRIWVPLFRKTEKKPNESKKYSGSLPASFLCCKQHTPNPSKGLWLLPSRMYIVNMLSPCRLAYLLDYFQALCLASCQRLHRTAVRCKDTDFFKILSGASVLASWRTYA